MDRARCEKFHYVFKAARRAARAADTAARRAAAAVPFAAAARLVGELAGITLTGKRAGRRAEADGNAAAARISAGAAAGRLAVLPPAGPLPDMLYVAIDGTGVPMVAAETEGRPGKAEDGRAHTREVKMAVVFTQTCPDGENCDDTTSDA